MAKAEKTKSSGGGKKWLIAIAILVLIAIIVTVIVLVIPGDTQGAIERLKQASQTSFLQNTSEQEEYEQIGNKLSNSTLSYYVTEYNDVETTANTINIILNFYNEYLPLAEDNRTLQSNHKQIENNLEEAVNFQQDMNAIMSQMMALNTGSDTHLKSLWIDFRLSFTDYILSMASAVEALNNCYQGCFTETLSNNLASTTILNTVDDFLSVITNEFVILTETNLQDTSAADYDYTSFGKVSVFSSFVNTYLNDVDDIYSYYFDSYLQEKYQKVDSFYSTYLQTNFEGVISSINSSLEIEFSQISNDTTGVLDSVIAYLKM